VSLLEADFSSTLTSLLLFLHFAFHPQDFHDGKHRQVLGGSWATTPSIAGRRTVVNQYQSLYGYVFAGARVAFDAKDRSRSKSPKA